MDANTPEGIRALEFYDPVAKKHGQAHMQARLGITQWLIKEGIARVEEIRAGDGTLENLYIRVGLFEFEYI
jgi:dipeptidyl-peptidase-3